MLGDLHEHIMLLLRQASNRLTSSGLPTRVFVNENFSGYQAVTNNPTDTVYSLYIEMGASPNHSNCKIVTLGQIFWDKYPNLSLVTMIEVDENGAPTDNEAVFNTDLDSKFSNIILPLMYTAFNSLDPTGYLRGQVVQRYTNNRVLLRDLIPAGFFTLRLLNYASMTGQVATIAGDFADSLTRLLAGMIKPITSNPKNRVLVIPAKDQASSILIPVPNVQDHSANPYTITSSVAMDECFRVAVEYLDNCVPNS